MSTIAASGNPDSGSNAQAPAPDLRSDTTTMGVVGLAHSTSHFFQLLLPTLFPWLGSAFSLSFAQLGSLATVFFVVSAAGQAAAGFIVDRYGARPTLFASLAACIAAAIIAANAQGYSGLLLAAIVAGVGNSPFHPVDYSILNQRISPERLGHAYSVHGISGNLGWGLAALFLVSIATQFGWRIALWSAAGYAVFVLLVCVYFRDALLTTHHVRKSTAGAEKVPAEGAFAFLKLPVVWVCWLFFFVLTFSLGAVQNFSIPAMQLIGQVSLPVAAAALTGYMVIGALGQVVGGFAISRKWFNPDRGVAIALSFSALMLGLAASGVLSGVYGGVVVIFVAMAGLGQGMAAPSRDLLIKQVTPKQATGRVYGTVYSGLDVGLAVSPLLFGYLMDHGMPRVMFAAAAVCLLLSIGAGLWVGSFVKKD